MCHYSLFANTFRQRLVLCGNQSLDLKSKWIDWFLYGSSFCWGYFRIEYSTVFVLESSHRKVPFSFYTCGNFIIDGFADRQPLVLLKNAFVGVFILFVYAYSTGAYYDGFPHCMFLLLLIDLIYSRYFNINILYFQFC